MSQDLRQMEWLYHVDLDVTKHLSKGDIARSAGMAWDIIQHHNPPQPGDKLVVIAVVRPQSGRA